MAPNDIMRRLPHRPFTTEEEEEKEKEEGEEEEEEEEEEGRWAC